MVLWYTKGRFCPCTGVDVWMARIGLWLLCQTLCLYKLARAVTTQCASASCSLTLIKNTQWVDSGGDKAHPAESYQSATSKGLLARAQPPLMIVATLSSYLTVLHQGGCQLGAGVGSSALLAVRKEVLPFSPTKCYQNRAIEKPP